MLYTCLFAVDGHDLRALLRSGATDADLSDAIETIWLGRGDRYSELRSEATSSLPRIEMFAMGG
jgi:cyclic pyranopterin phosphate synthase